MPLTANGSTITFGGTALTERVNVSFTENGAEIDVANLGSSVGLVETGIKNQELTVTINGRMTATSFAYGATGALVLTLADNTSATVGIGTAVITEVAVSGGKDQPVTSSIKFRPHA